MDAILRALPVLMLAFWSAAALAQGSDTDGPDPAQAGAADDAAPGGRTGYPSYPDMGRPGVAVTEDRTDPPEQVVAGLSSDSVGITASFDGSEILIYGAVKREAPIPGGLPLQVVVTVEGPAQAVTVWRKERRAGIWVNTESLDVGSAPSFYAVATTGPLDQILLPEWDARYRISVPLAVRAFAGPVEVSDTVPFTEALIHLREKNGLYRLDEGSVSIVDQTLFRADVSLPANLIEGDYKTRIFLLRNGEVVDVYRAPIEVRKVGLERWLYNLAFDWPLIYGLMSLAVAVAAGWGASVAFRLLRRS